MALTSEQIRSLSNKSVSDIKAVMSSLTPEDISGLYDLEVAKSTPRNGAVDLLMAESNNNPPLTDTTGNDDDEEEVAVDEDAFQSAGGFSMVWYDGTKCKLQNGKIYNRVTNDFIK